MRFIRLIVVAPRTICNTNLVHQSVRTTSIYLMADINHRKKSYERFDA